MKFALDAMGGDFAPEATVEGALLASAEISPEDEILLIGDQEAMEAVLAKHNAIPQNIHLMHAPEVIGMGEHPLKAFSQKQKSSIAIGYGLLKKKQVDAFCSAGNTGAMLVGAIYSIKLAPVSRPAIMSYVPKLPGGHSVMLDVGANTDCKAEVLQQFAELGSIFYQYINNIAKPRVALINLGEEPEKGNLITQAAYKLLEKHEKINFVGNVEGRELFQDKADVLVCDGFVGNVIIKMAESYYEILKQKNITDPFFDNFNFESIGGSPILGVDGTAVIGHGISNAQAVKSMILLAQKMTEAKISQKIKEALA